MPTLPKLNLATLAILSVISISAAPSVHARNPLKDAESSQQQQHHSGDGRTLVLGGYDVVCINGESSVESRNINVNGHNQQVLHMSAQRSSQSLAFLNNLDTVPTFLKSPITFTLAKGNGRLLIVNLSFVTPGGENLFLSLVTPDSKVPALVPFLPVTYLISNGNGQYTVPSDSNGIPRGSQLLSLSLEQIGNFSDCSKHAIDFNELQINRRFVGISSDPAAFCDKSCGDGG